MKYFVKLKPVIIWEAEVVVYLTWLSRKRLEDRALIVCVMIAFWLYFTRYYKKEVISAKKLSICSLMKGSEDT